MNKLKGDLYEIYVRNYLNQDKIAYLWKDTPEKFLIEAKLIHSNNENRLRRKKNMLLENPLVDVGVDIFQVDSNNNFTLVQCKNGYENGVTIEHLSGFYMMMANHYHLNGSVYYTSKLSHHITENHVNQKISYIKLPILDLETKSNIKNVLPIVPYDYQIEASNKIKDYFDQNNKAILSLPCGCGKTYTSYLISQKFQSIIILSPLKQFAKQNMDRYIDYGYTKSHLLIDSDGTRNSQEISEFIISNNNSVLLSATYNSVDKILEIIHLLNNPLIIVDEFHNLSKNNVTNQDDPFYKLLETDHKFLFMSATPRVYELEDEFEDGNLGEIVYNLSFSDAIEKNYICDYKIYLPSVSEDNSSLIDDIKTEIDISLFNDNMKAKCMFLFKALLHHGSRKCIVYCQNIDEIKTMMSTMGKLNEYYLMDFNMSSIISLTKRKNREDILDHFIESDNVELIFSVRILDECIDITKCDSIYITYPTTSKIRTIQRLCRCIRKDKDNKFKIGHVYIWCDEYADILDTLSGIKEYDILFKDKISVLDLNWKGEKNIEDIVIKDKQTVVNYIVGIKEFRTVTWYEKLEDIKKYIDKYDKFPSTHDKNSNYNRSLASWVLGQEKYYKKQIYGMKDEHRRNKWKKFRNEYKKYPITNGEKWCFKFEEVKIFVIENDRLPSCSKNEKIEIQILSRWVLTQNKRYNAYDRIMSKEKYRNLWDEFRNKYIYLFDKDEWSINYEELELFLENNSKLPTEKTHKILSKWMEHQNQNYSKKNQSMQTQERRDLWDKLRNKYKPLFMSDKEIWYIHFDDVIYFVNENKILPTVKTNKILCNWVNAQKTNYKKGLGQMKNQEIRKKWEEFKILYPHLFLTKNEKWDIVFSELLTFIKNNNKLPTKITNPYLYKWLSRQNTNYKKSCGTLTIENERRKTWEKFQNEYK
jgi:superfamily II DNA or RNA helicase